MSFRYITETISGLLGKQLCIPTYQRTIEWDINKTYEICDILFKKFNKHKNKECDMGVFIIFHPSDSNNEYVFDGQHRIVFITLLIKVLLEFGEESLINAYEEHLYLNKRALRLINHPNNANDFRLITKQKYKYEKIPNIYLLDENDNKAYSLILNNKKCCFEDYWSIENIKERGKYEDRYVIKDENNENKKSFSIKNKSKCISYAKEHFSDFSDSNICQMYQAIKKYIIEQLNNNNLNIETLLEFILNGVILIKRCETWEDSCEEFKIINMAGQELSNERKFKLKLMFGMFNYNQITIFNNKIQDIEEKIKNMVYVFEIEDYINLIISVYDKEFNKIFDPSYDYKANNEYNSKKLEKILDNCIKSIIKIKEIFNSNLFKCFTKQKLIHKKLIKYIIHICLNIDFITAYKVLEYFITYNLLYTFIDNPNQLSNKQFISNFQNELKKYYNKEITKDNLLMNIKSIIVSKLEQFNNSEKFNNIYSNKNFNGKNEEAKFVLNFIEVKSFRTDNTIDFSNSSVEHIYPQNPDNNVYNNDNMLEDINNTYLLGNMTLFEQNNDSDGNSGNSSLSNNSNFVEKKEAFGKSRYNITREIETKYPEHSFLDSKINERHIYLRDKLWEIINTTLFI